MSIVLPYPISSLNAPLLLGVILLTKRLKLNTLPAKTLCPSLVVNTLPFPSLWS